MFCVLFRLYFHIQVRTVLIIIIEGGLIVNHNNASSLHDTSSNYIKFQFPFGRILLWLSFHQSFEDLVLWNYSEIPCGKLCGTSLDIYILCQDIGA